MSTNIRKMIGGHDIYDTIITALSYQGYMNASTLLIYLNEKGQPIKRAQLYNILRHLQTKKIIYKNKTLYTLHSKYIQQIKNLSDRIARFVPLTDNLTITVGCFLELNQARPYYAYQIRLQSPGISQQHKYCRHRTYHLSGRADQPHQPQYEHLPIKQYILSNQTTYLDTYTLGLKRENVTQANKNCNIFDFQGYNCNIIGDYIMQIFLGPTLRSALEKIYQTTNDITNFDQASFRQLFLMKEPCKLIIAKDPAGAERWRDEIEKELI